MPYGRPYDFPILLVPMLVLPGGRCPENRRMSLSGMLFLTILQIMLMNSIFGDINIVVNELGSTFFWIPLALTAAWFSSCTRARGLLEKGPRSRCTGP